MQTTQPFTDELKIDISIVLPVEHGFQVMTDGPRCVLHPSVFFYKNEGEICKICLLRVAQRVFVERVRDILKLETGVVDFTVGVPNEED